MSAVIHRVPRVAVNSTTGEHLDFVKVDPPIPYTPPGWYQCEDFPADLGVNFFAPEGAQLP